MALAAGQRIGTRYELISKLGSGGMADVWLARDEMLGRQVALKFLHERFAQDEQFVERFRREAQAAAGLQHPNVVGVYDRGENDDRHWIAMEYVEGAMLKDLIGRGLSIGETVEIVRQILTGAKFAHARGIVHRDLKPHNVMVDREGRARVTDFGIARAGASEITATGSVLGTAQYLSPEQAQGLEITAASDLYSIGVILYEALTGEVPFDADSAVAVALKQVSEQPRPPSALNPSVPRSLDAVVLRALAKDPRNRFNSAAEFLRALDLAETDPSGASLDETTAHATLPVVRPIGETATTLAPLPVAVDPAPTGESPLLASPEAGRGWLTRRRAALLGAIALLAVALVAFALTRDGGSSQVLVPSVIEQQLSTARAALEQRGFDVSELPVPSCSELNTVTEQDPLAGTEVDEGAEVTLTVSLGLSVEIPEVRGESEADATKILEDENLLVETREQGSKDVPAGKAIGTEPGPGTAVDCKDTVILAVSSGQNLVSLPDVVGQSRELAESELRRLGFIPDIDPRDADEPEGTVIGQDPAPGSELPRGEQITLIVSTGAGSVIVPDVVGQPRDTATSRLTGEGLDVDVVEQEVDQASDDDRVLEQAPAPGTRVRQGDRVTIFVGVFVEEPVIEPPSTSTTTTIPNPDEELDPPPPRRGGR